MKQMTELTVEKVERVLKGLKEEFGHDFSGYSIGSLTRRLEKITKDRNKSIDEIISEVRANPDLLNELINQVTVNTTELFRNPEMWNLLFREMGKRNICEDQVNIWHVGVSSGQEAYSLMVLLNELGLFYKSNITGTDLNDKILKVAEKGIYKYTNLPDYLKNYINVLGKHNLMKIWNYFKFSKTDGTITVNRELVKRIKYVKHDITKKVNPNDFKYHIIMCRNLLIYFNHDTQKQILKFLCECLHEGGILVLGKHEGIFGELNSKFKKKGLIYIKK